MPRLPRPECDTGRRRAGPGVDAAAAARRLRAPRRRQPIAAVRRAAGRSGAGAARHRRGRRHGVRTQTAVAEPTTGAYAMPERRPLPLEGVRVEAEISGATRT